jgi:hypothetical protein
MLRVAQLSAYYYIRPNAFYSPHRVVASRRGPRTNILLSRTSNLARGSDVDCLIRQTLKFCQLTAGFSGSRLEKKKSPLFVVIDTGRKALVAHSASITIAEVARNLSCCFANWALFLFLPPRRHLIMIRSTRLAQLVTHHLLYSCPMIALET